MKYFSTTFLPVPYKGNTNVPFPILCEVDDNLWMLMDHFSYTGDDNITYSAPKGMLTDLTSIPRQLWDLLPPFGRYSGAAVIHDYLYQSQITTKEIADRVLEEAMDMVNVPHFIKQLIYEGVKIGGQIAWDQHSKEIAASRLLNKS